MLLRHVAGLLVLLSLPLAPALTGCQGRRPETSQEATQQPQAKAVLRIGAIPDTKPEKLNRLYALVEDQLSQSLGVAVKYVPVVDYGAAVSAFRTGDLDMVWFGGLSGVQARLQTPGSRLIAQRDIDASFQSVFIANADTNLAPVETIEGLAQLKGKRMSFGSENSTSGTLMPLYFLSQAGVNPDDFSGGRPGYSGSHDTTIALVESGAYEAGALNAQVWTSSLKEGKTNPNKVREIWRTPGYHDYHWIAQAELDDRFGEGFTDKLQRTVLDWSQDDPAQRRILELFGAERFIPAKARNYDQIETIGRTMGKIR